LPYWRRPSSSRASRSSRGGVDSDSPSIETQRPGFLDVLARVASPYGEEAGAGWAGRPIPPTGCRGPLCAPMISIMYSVDRMSPIRIPGLMMASSGRAGCMATTSEASASAVPSGSSLERGPRKSSILGRRPKVRVARLATSYGAAHARL
jgi:hypothetical protein